MFGRAYFMLLEGREVFKSFMLASHDSLCYAHTPLSGPTGFVRKVPRSNYGNLVYDRLY